MSSTPWGVSVSTTAEDPDEQGGEHGPETTYHYYANGAQKSLTDPDDNTTDLGI